MTTGGTRAVRAVMSYSNKPIKPKENKTPFATTIIDINVALNDRKNIYKIKDVINNVNNINIDTSSLTFIESIVLKYGMPEYLTSKLFNVRLYFSPEATILSINYFRFGVSRISLLIFTSINADHTSLLYNMPS